jgi:hemin uptake protein HemP
MAGEVGDDRFGNGKVRRLSDAVRRVRIAESERADAYADLHDGDRARLALLVEELDGVFAELPDEDPFFICEVAGSTPPRLWIDPTSHVVMGRDRRTYRFLKETRLGRLVLNESDDVTVTADAITDYIAERVIERERTLESDALVAKLKTAVTPAREAAPIETAPAATGGDRPARIVSALTLFLAGFAVGALGLVAYAWFMVPG